VKRRNHRFTVILLPERDPEFAGYYNALVPALPGCVSYGTNKDAALRNIREAIEAYIDDPEAEGEKVSNLGKHAEPVEARRALRQAQGGLSTVLGFENAKP